MNNKNKIHIINQCVLVLFLITSCSTLISCSCYVTKSIYTGNKFSSTVGQSKNEILRHYGVPDRTTDDGNGGEILAYEKLTETTISRSGAISRSSSYTNGRAYYNNNAAVGNSNNRTYGSSNSAGITQSTIDKQYLYIYISSNNIVYDYKANYGFQYKSYQCYDRKLARENILLSILFGAWPIEIPVVIIEHKKAKKKGEICK